MKIKSLTDMLANGKKLVFTHILNDIYTPAKVTESLDQPEDFTNVIHLGKNLYFAFNCDTDDGKVFIGESI